MRTIAWSVHNAVSCDVAFLGVAITSAWMASLRLVCVVSSGTRISNRKHHGGIAPENSSTRHGTKSCALASLGPPSSVGGCRRPRAQVLVVRAHVLTRCTLVTKSQTCRRAVGLGVAVVLAWFASLRLVSCWELHSLSRGKTWGGGSLAPRGGLHGREESKEEFSTIHQYRAPLTGAFLLVNINFVGYEVLICRCGIVRDRDI